MLSPPAQTVLDELNEIVRLDGAELRVESSERSRVELTLDLSNASCPECVLPKELLTDLLATRLAQADPDVIEVTVHDPREVGADGPEHTAPAGH